MAYVIDKETGERRYEVGGEAQSIPQAPDLSRLEGMGREELIAVIERMERQCGMVAAMTEEETIQAMLDTLAHTALKPIIAGVNMKADIDSRLKAIDRWLDRKQGKAIQRIDQRVQNVGSEPLGEMTNEQLLVELRKLKELPAGMVLLEDGTIDADYDVIA